MVEIEKIYRVDGFIFEDIESASIKIIRVSSSKADKFLEIITKDKKRIQIRLNINNELLFLKLIQNKIGEKLDI